jgi:predicted CoA-binding protein
VRQVLQLHVHAKFLIELAVLRHRPDLEAVRALFDVHGNPPGEALDYSIRAMDDINTLRRILRQTRVIAVVGLSADWYRPSYFAAKYMQEHGYRVIPVNPKYDRILGEKCYKSLRDIPEPVDMVDVFRKTQDVPPIADDAIAIGAKVLWQQLSVRNEAAAAKARAAGLDAVLDRCVKIEHGRLFGGLNWVGVNTKVLSAKRPRWLAY